MTYHGHTSIPDSYAAPRAIIIEAARLWSKGRASEQSPAEQAAIQMIQTSSSPVPAASSRVALDQALDQVWRDPMWAVNMAIVHSQAQQQPAEEVLASVEAVFADDFGRHPVAVESATLFGVMSTLIGTPSVEAAVAVVNGDVQSSFRIRAAHVDHPSCPGALRWSYRTQMRGEVALWALMSRFLASGHHSPEREEWLLHIQRDGLRASIGLLGLLGPLPARALERVPPRFLLDEALLVEEDARLRTPAVLERPVAEVGREIDAKYSDLFEKLAH